ncbi:hypothetical protein SSS_02258 [Sarcoptes scabiei]|nr:hypothetical protein SSS_02258 [Sarcoptes scabiei]
MSFPPPLPNNPLFPPGFPPPNPLHLARFPIPLGSIRRHSSCRCCFGIGSTSHQSESKRNTDSSSRSWPYNTLSTNQSASGENNYYSGTQQKSFYYNSFCR